MGSGRLEEAALIQARTGYQKQKPRKKIQGYSVPMDPLARAFSIGI